MILAQATCGHFALFDVNEELIRQICRCPAPKITLPTLELKVRR